MYYIFVTTEGPLYQMKEGGKKVSTSSGIVLVMWYDVFRKQIVIYFLLMAYLLPVSK